MNSTVTHKGHRLNHLRPLLFQPRGQRSQHVPRGLVKPFCGAVAHGVVGRGVQLDNATHFQTLRYQLGFKARTLVGVNTLREAIDAKELFPELPRYALCCLVLTWECMCQLRDVVSNHEDSHILVFTVFR